jgi:hypothetical protein
MWVEPKKMDDPWSVEYAPRRLIGCCVMPKPADDPSVGWRVLVVAHDHTERLGVVAPEHLEKWGFVVLHMC